VKGGEGLTCVLLRGIGKVLGWGSTFTQKVGVIIRLCVLC
jgi:hypothetical protein